MGITDLWKLLDKEEVVERYAGANPADHAALVRAVDGQAIAVDLAMWIMQADQQRAILEHFSREERCMKVAFERSLQWLRHGCLPVIVVEGTAPEEKKGAHQARHASRYGVCGGGGQAGRSNGQFQRLGQLVGGLLRELGLPVFQAPGEAEAACAALERAGAVDACDSFDSDALVHGAQMLFKSLKLSTTQAKECEAHRVSMASVRRRLGLRRGGERALAAVGMLVGTDYNLEGAAGVGSVGALAVAQHLLQGDTDDSRVIERLEALLRSEPNHYLLSLAHCTGCSQCGHDGGRKGKIKCHSAKNPCPLCPPSQDGKCCATASSRCRCPFHEKEAERRVERIADRVRRNPDFLQEAKTALAVFDRQRAEADAAIAQQLAAMGLQPGQRLAWLHRPRVQAVFDYLDARRQQLQWDLPDVRSKLLPVLLEWDLRMCASALGGTASASPTSSSGTGSGTGRVELRPVEVQKLQGQKGNKPPLPGEQGEQRHWRYVLRWERSEEDLEGIGSLLVRKKAGRGRAAAAQAGQDDAGLGLEGEAALGSQGMLLGTQGAAWQGEEERESVSVAEFDRRWLAEVEAEKRAVRCSAVAALAPQLESAWRQGAAGGSRKARVGGAGAKRGSSKARAGGAATASPQQPKQQQPEQLDKGGAENKGSLNQFLVHRRASDLLGEPEPAARLPASSKASAAGAARQPARRGLAGGGGGSGDSGRGGEGSSAHLPTSLAGAGAGGVGRGGEGSAAHLPSDLGSLRALLDRVLPSQPPEAAAAPPAAAPAAAGNYQPAEADLTGGGNSQQEQQQPGEQVQPAVRAWQARSPLQPSPSKKQRSDPGSPEFEIVLDSPDSPRVLPLARRLQLQQHQQLLDPQQQQHEQQQHEQQQQQKSGPQQQREKQQQQVQAAGACSSRSRRAQASADPAIPAPQGQGDERRSSSCVGSAAICQFRSPGSSPLPAGPGRRKGLTYVTGPAEDAAAAEHTAEVVNLVTPPPPAGLLPAPDLALAAGLMAGQSVLLDRRQQRQDEQLGQQLAAGWQREAEDLEDDVVDLTQLTP